MTPTTLHTDDKNMLGSLHGVIVSVVVALTAELVLSTAFRLGTTFSAIGRVAVLFLILYTVHRFALESLQRYRPTAKDYLTLTLTLLASILVVWLGRILSLSVASYAETSTLLAGVSANSFFYAIPYSAGALILQAILGLHFGLVFAISLSVIIGVYSPGQPIMIPYVLATCLMACLSLSRFRSRSAYLKAGLNISLIAFPFALGSLIISGDLHSSEIICRLIGALFSGVFCSFLAMGFTPIVESLGGYVTDMRLLEMATIDHPLLKELSVQAPGTWNHSMVMGMMVEAAADGIGANAVLARVGAYFHDIGKLSKPLYFVENQGGGKNQHDKLSTSMSALIIRSHVKDGIEMAKKHRLPTPIVDMIPQHHGTSLIEYFYDKACKEAGEADGEDVEVDKSLYRYPGPKPQTKAAGILMLADGIEAATRTLSDPSVDRIQGLVQKMMNKVFSSGQLNECDLTLRDLHIIAKNFTRVLSSIYHQRVAYAEPAEKVNEKSAEQAAAAAAAAGGKNGKREEKKDKKEKRDDGQKKGVGSSGDGAPAQAGAAEKNGDPADSKDSKKPKEDLKRLGL